MKYLTLAVVALLLVGCSFMGFHPSSKTIVVTKSPVKVVMSGELDTDDYAHARNMVALLSDTTFMDYNFTDTTVSVSGSETTNLKQEDIKKKE